MFAGAERPADAEFAVHALIAQAVQVREQRLGCAGAVETDQDRVAVPVLGRDLGQGGVDDRDVIDGGVRACVPGSEHPGQGFVGVVAERQHRMKAPRPFEGGRCLILVRVRDHQGGVLVDHQHRPSIAREQRRPGDQ